MTVKMLDATQKQNVSYCIPLWLRDLQIQLAIRRISARIQPATEKRKDPVAIACFGPSLNDTWEKIRDFKYVISCSGSHKFLIDRGIVPTWHAEVDPRAHKVQLIGTPHKDVEYLIASTCHPAVFEHLTGMNVKLWHVYAPDEDSLRILPYGEWALTGGSGIGLRAMSIARFLGFSDLHIFGMDGSEGPTGKHAAEHPSQPQGHSETVVNGRTFRTTPSLLECARQTFHELDQMPDVEATFHGDGLVQEMAKNWERKEVPQGHTALGINKPELISPAYRELNRRLHESQPVYGVGGGTHKDAVLKMMEKTGAKSVLDYGCGKSMLAQSLPFPIWEYDPSIPGKEAAPRPADLVVCLDVLEHIEPEKLDLVLADIRRCTKLVTYMSIFTGPAAKVLPDGRNTHLIQEGEAWWKTRLARFFVNLTIMRQPALNGDTLLVVGTPRLDKGDMRNAMVMVADRPRRWQVLEKWVKDRGWARGVEVGVKDGRTYLHLLENCPSLKLIGVDLFEPRPGIEAQGGESHDKADLPGHEKRLREITKKCYSTRGTLLKGDSVKKAQLFADGSLDFVFIDADHREEAVRADIAAWRPKIRAGGTLCGHDAQEKFPGVVRAINDLLPGWKLHEDSVWEFAV